MGYILRVVVRLEPFLRKDSIEFLIKILILKLLNAKTFNRLTMLEIYEIADLKKNWTQKRFSCFYLEK